MTVIRDPSTQKRAARCYGSRVVMKLSELAKLPRRWLAAWMQRNLRLAINLYPPYLGTGIRVAYIAPDYREIRVEMPLRPWNRNYVGTHFGGSLYAMCDPFFMLMLIKNLGPAFLVWDQAATIRFRRPGRGRVAVRVELSEERIAQVREAALRDGRTRATFTATVEDDAGTVVAEVEKVIYVRPKEVRPEGGASAG